ncbi:MAG TPA: heavy metal translocating P-type ATPase [Steroidobacteraceae bacterium]
MPALETCFHCGSSAAIGVRAIGVDGVERSFCCGGCAAATGLIFAQGLERYYSFRTASDQAPRYEQRSWSIYDRDRALRSYTHVREDGDRELSLQIDGMHCAACAWLLDNSLRQLEGIRDIQVNAGSARAEIRFDPTQVSLSRVLQSIYVLGYEPRPLSFTAGAPPWQTERRTALKRLAVAGFGMMQVMTYAVSLYAGALQGIAPDLEQLLRFVSLLVATPVVLYAAQPFFIAAWRGLRRRTLVMDLPVALSIAAAYLWSVWSTLRGRGAVYFDSAVMFTFFLLLGRFVEMSLRNGFGLQQDAIARLLPESILRITATGEERVIPDELSAGDRVRILPGERVPADGEILCGRTEVDESMLTGESLPRVRAAGENLIAGTLNLANAVDMRITGVGQDSTLAAVSRLLERARASRPHIAEAADAMAVWFVAGVLVLAVIAALYWLHVDAARAFPTVLAVLVVTCPCALSLATPAALAAATTQLARMGLIVTRGRALETLARADCVVFDKTGTLTFGQPVLTEIRLLRANASRERCLAVAAALERHSGHPIARAFAKQSPALDVSDTRSCSGLGIEGRVGDRRYRIGRAEYVRELCATPVAAPQIPEGRSSIFLSDSAGLLAEFVLCDALRTDARDALQQLRRLGLEPLIASGDRTAVVTGIARQLDAAPGLGDLRPADKLNFVRSLQAERRIVAMVGDGVNDAPVLAGADVSVAIGGGTDLAKVTADIVMLGEALAPLPAGIETARRCMRIIRQNLTWAVLYNAAAVPLAASGWLQPWMAAIGMSASSLLVTLNALRLLRPPRPATAALDLPLQPPEVSPA